MAYNSDSEAYPTQVKILVAGGFGVGKTTFVGAASEIESLHTEELITAVSVGTDNLNGVEEKAITTVAFDFGRITFANNELVLYLFGTPGQERFWFMWDELSAGALGAVVLADTRRLSDCFESIDFFESRGISFLVAVNRFTGAYEYELEEVRTALRLGTRVPVVMCDARDPRSSTLVLTSLIQHLITAVPAHSALGGPNSALRLQR